MAISAADIQKLRASTGAGMLEAKNALTEANGDFDGAVEILRVAGAAKMAKRADRDASNGLVASSGKSLIQLAAETDFVAKNAEFMALAQNIADAVSENGATDVESALATKFTSDETVADAIGALAAKIGEKLELANVATFEGDVVIYLHRRSQDLPPQVGVMVEYVGSDPEFVRGIAMQIAAMSPQYVTREEVPEKVVEYEKHVAELTAKEEGKPEKIIPRIVEGRINGFYKDVVLLEQASVSDDKKTVGQLVKENGTEIKRFIRFEAGAK
ncbi:MAG: translation elongation factor Ts [Propionibacteriaceae bacterium]|jgi:elongation factor Ts|nr:translation elongation factor Ts [Propionibacteriaceae bacterium]